MGGDEKARHTAHRFREGDHVLLIDRKGRRYLVRLRRGHTFHSHLGALDHDHLIGLLDGSRVRTNRGHRLLALSPTMADFTLEMPRIATVIYPKDLGAILVYGDIFPGARVLEAGTGSGALTIALLRAVGPQGLVVSYDVRQDMLERARKNIEALLPEHASLVLKRGDVSQGFEERELDRVVLDLPEPWTVVPHAAEALVPGGLFLSFLPTVLQVHQLVTALRRDGRFDLLRTVEVLERSWHVAEHSVRPDHRMVAHTGFITTARRCQPPDSQDDATLEEASHGTTIGEGPLVAPSSVLPRATGEEVEVALSEAEGPKAVGDMPR